MNYYRTLLEKYIQHVVDCEGTDFIHHINSSAQSDVKFSEEEKKALEDIRDELYY